MPVFSDVFFHKSAVDLPVGPVGISCGPEVSVGLRIRNMTMTSISLGRSFEGVRCSRDA